MIEIPQDTARRLSARSGPDDSQLTPCAYCGYPFDKNQLGRYGCPKCIGEGLKELEQQNPNKPKRDIKSNRKIKELYTKGKDRQDRHRKVSTYSNINKTL